MDKYATLRDAAVAAFQASGTDVQKKAFDLLGTKGLFTIVAETDTQFKDLVASVITEVETIDEATLKTAIEAYPSLRALLAYVNNYNQTHAPKFKCESREVYTSKEVTFESISGNNKVKEDISRGFIQPFVYPLLFRERSNGMLFYGPPGTGKTLFAKACSAELPNTILFAPTIGEIRGKYEGETEKNIKEVFGCASQAATALGPEYVSLIFFDEIDSIAGLKTSESMARTVNALLQLMDGTASFKNVSVLGATNYPWKIEPAILRRFTSKIFVDLPDREAIVAIILGVINSAYRVGETSGVDLMANYGKQDVRTMAMGLADTFLPTAKGTQFLEKWRGGNTSKPPESPLMFGYSPSDITKIIKEAISYAASEALDYPTDEIVIEGQTYLHAHEKGKGTVALELPDAERGRVVSFGLRRTHIDYARSTIGQTVSNGDYFKYLWYAKYSSLPEEEF